MANTFENYQCAKKHWMKPSYLGSVGLKLLREFKTSNGDHLSFNPVYKNIAVKMSIFSHTNPCLVTAIHA
jgi:hypothetical protein